MCAFALVTFSHTAREERWHSDEVTFSRTAREERWHSDRVSLSRLLGFRLLVFVYFRLSLGGCARSRLLRSHVQHVRNAGTRTGLRYHIQHVRNAGTRMGLRSHVQHVRNAGTLIAIDRLMGLAIAIDRARLQNRAGGILIPPKRSKSCARAFLIALKRARTSFEH